MAPRGRCVGDESSMAPRSAVVETSMAARGGVDSVFATPKKSRSFTLTHRASP